ncbi:hypothetical protein LTR24_006060 [Lithohypha guttulata]|uniref:DUF3433 domain containing protein n=1 Tax=Lithohypha guttulata TaxID=1690604 RepID=A0ABR0K730_9EURO|nr:hypothetical protein LTR24_006060 [Lithohypha guttulata]
MDESGHAPFAGFEPVRMAGGASNYSSHPSYSAHHRRHSSIPEEMLVTDETREEDFADTRPLAKNSVNVDAYDVPQETRNTSVLRRLTRSLRSGGSRYRTRPSQRKEYATVHDSNAHDVSADLSSLEGLGIELREVTSPNTSHYASVDQQDTACRGANDEPQKPSFNDFRKRMSLGSGMVIGAKLQRDPSLLEQTSDRNSSRVEQDNLRRMKTVRQLGKSLAEERGQIVAYSEGVDLSSLEGPSIRHRQSTTFDDMSLNRASTMPDTQSYYFPSDPQIPNWKPFSMRPPWIIMLTVIAFGLAGFQEGLCQWSLQKQNRSPPTAILAFNTVAEVSTWWFFVWKYLPTMITIGYSVLFSIMDFNVRRLEPYYQLSQPQGARASASLNLDHLTMFQYFVPFNAARLGQWTVFASTFANIIAATIAPALQNPSINFEKNPACNITQDGRIARNIQCPDPDMQKFWVLVDPIWSRLLTAAYVIVGLTLIFLFIQLRRKSGLLSDPKGIAGIASMATKSHILQDFKGLDLATRGDIHKRLARRTYVLYKSSIWQGEFNSNPDSHEFQDSSRRLHSPHPIMLQLTAGIPFIIILTVLLACVPIISLTKARIIPNTVPWLPILVATVLKLIWSTFEADVRLIEPFYQLSKGDATPQNSLTLDYQSTVYGWMPIRAALNGHFLVALVGLSSVFLDILSVTIGSFSVDSGVFLRKLVNGGKNAGVSAEDETYISFWVSLVLSILILLFVISVAILVYARRRHPFLPREPSTIAAVLSFIYSSKMLTDFIDTELLDNKAMETRLKNLNKRYALGWFYGRDGKIHCAIDEQPMVSKYTHGKPYSDAVSGPLSERETFYYP